MIDLRDGAAGALMRALGALSAVLILALTLVTCIDVVGRYWFDAPLPLTTRDGGHVEVDLMGLLLGARADRVLIVFGNLVAALVLALFAWRLGAEALKLGADGAVTNALRVPLAPVAWFGAAACLMSAAAALLRGLGAGRRARAAGTEEGA